MSYDFFFLKIYHVCLNIIPFQSTKSFKLCFFKYMYCVLSDYRCQSIDQLFKSLRIHDYYIMITLPISIVCTFISVDFFFCFMGRGFRGSDIRIYESYTLMNLLKRHVLF